MKLNTISFPRSLTVSLLHTTHEARNPKPERFRLHRKLSQACDEIKWNHQMETKELATLLNFSRTSLAVFLVLVLVQLDVNLIFYIILIYIIILIIVLFHIYVSFFICTANNMCIILISLTSHLTFTFF